MSNKYHTKRSIPITKLLNKNINKSPYMYNRIIKEKH